MTENGGLYQYIKELVVLPSVYWLDDTLIKWKLLYAVIMAMLPIKYTHYKYSLAYIISLFYALEFSYFIWMKSKIY